MAQSNPKSIYEGGVTKYQIGDIIRVEVSHREEPLTFLIEDVSNADRRESSLYCVRDLETNETKMMFSNILDKRELTVWKVA